MPRYGSGPGAHEGQFKPGQSGNPGGRPPGSRNTKTKEILAAIKEAGHKDPLFVLSDLATNSTDEGIRQAAASSAAPYVHSKWQATPVPRFIDIPLNVPEFTSVSDANQFLAKIDALTANGELDFQSALDLTTITKAYIDSVTASDIELRIRALEEQSAPVEDEFPSDPDPTPEPPAEGDAT